MSPLPRLAKSLAILIVLLASFTLLAAAQTVRPDILQDRAPAVAAEAVANAPCVNGLADGEYPCSGVDLLAFMPLADIGGGEGSDIWGWTDPETGKEYALMARSNGLAIVDISDPFAPIYVGNLPSRFGASVWRDVKVYQNHAYVVADGIGDHGMQIFDLTTLTTLESFGVDLAQTAVYTNVGAAHNIFINEDSGYGYIVGASSCAGGLHMVDLQKPTDPTFAGCFSSDGYTHDTQCVMYSGPDAAYSGAEICLNANEDTLTIVDVSNKNAPVQLSRKGHAGSAYTHQGWLTSDQAYYLMNDEADEAQFGHNTRTYIWDVQDLDNPIFLGAYESKNPSLDHNLYIQNDTVFEANYTSGLRIFAPTNVSKLQLTPLGHFDTYPESDSPSFNGAWSSYPFFASGTIIVSDSNRGLFIVRPDFLPAYTLKTAVQPVAPAFMGQTVEHMLTITNTGNQTDSYTIDLAGNNWLTTPSTTTVGPLAPNEEATIAIAVTIGSEATDSVSVTVTSQGNNDVKQVLQLTTQATPNVERIFLPIIR